MKGSLQKGNRIERDFCDKLKAMGFVTDRAERSMRIIPDFKRPGCPTCHRHFTFTISKKHDTFGCFDVIAKNPEFPDWTLYFQIAANRWKYGEDKQNMENFPAGKYDFVVMIRKMDRKPYDVRWYRYNTEIGKKEWAKMPIEHFFKVIDLLHDDPLLPVEA